MTLRKVGKDLSASDYWAARNDAYAAEMSAAYHNDRLAMIRSLFTFKGGTVLDFGCGDGVMLLDFPDATRIGIDLDAGLLGMARAKVPGAEFVHGGVDALGCIADASIDLLLCLNVAAYFTDAEDDRFYREAGRLLRAGGTLVITHSNALFDLFTFNAFTVEFFKTNFGCDVSDLLKHPDKPVRTTFNIRENPLAYAGKLARYGFTQIRQGFSHFHPVPPLQSNPDIFNKPYRDTLAAPEHERWKLMFQCSMFGASARA